MGFKDSLKNLKSKTCFDPNSKLPTNVEKQATAFWICQCKAVQIRTFHVTWFSFWLCFFGWFATANLWKWQKVSLDLTPRDRAIAGGCSVGSTIIARIAVGIIIQKVGSRLTYTILMLLGAIPIALMAVVQSNVGFIIVSFFIGIVGASFVITQNHVMCHFGPKVVGTANAVSAGWGNFGGGCSNAIMPLLFGLMQSFGADDDLAWRLSLLVPSACLMVITAPLYFFFTKDNPFGNLVPSSDLDDNPEYQERMKAKEEMKKEREENEFKKQLEASGSTLTKEEFEREIKKKERNLTISTLLDYRLWILFGVYAICFGVELTVVRFTVGFYEDDFGLSTTQAGSVVLMFSAINLFARPLGGVIGDLVSYFTTGGIQSRVYALFITLLLEAFFLALYSLSTYVDSLAYSIVLLIFFSVFVQAAEGLTFAVVPFIQPERMGLVSGIVAAGGNFGAMLYAFTIFFWVPDELSYTDAWHILAGIVLFFTIPVIAIRFSSIEIQRAKDMAQTYALEAKEAEANTIHSKI